MGSGSAGQRRLVCGVSSKGKRRGQEEEGTQEGHGGARLQDLQDTGRGGKPRQVVGLGASGEETEKRMAEEFAETTLGRLPPVPHTLDAELNSLPDCPKGSFLSPALVGAH